MPYKEQNQLFVMREGHMVYVQILGIHDQDLADVMGISGSYAGSKWTTKVFDLQLEEVPTHKGKENDPRRIPRMPVVHDGPEPVPLPEEWPGPTGYTPKRSTGKKKTRGRHLKRKHSPSRKTYNQFNSIENIFPQEDDSDEWSSSSDDNGTSRFLNNNTKCSPHEHQKKGSDVCVSELDVRVQLTAQDRAIAELLLMNNNTKCSPHENQKKGSHVCIPELDVRVQLTAQDRAIAEHYIATREKTGVVQMSSLHTKVVQVQISAHDRANAESHISSGKSGTIPFSDILERAIRIKLEEQDHSTSEPHIVIGKTSTISISRFLGKEVRVQLKTLDINTAEKQLTSKGNSGIVRQLKARDCGATENKVSSQGKSGTFRAPLVFGREVRVQLTAKDRAKAENHIRKSICINKA